MKTDYVALTYYNIVIIKIHAVVDIGQFFIISDTFRLNRIESALTLRFLYNKKLTIVDIIGPVKAKMGHIK